MDEFMGLDLLAQALVQCGATGRQGAVETALVVPGRDHIRQKMDGRIQTTGQKIHHLGQSLGHRCGNALVHAVASEGAQISQPKIGAV
jgi:hypothetical protein